MRGPFKIFVCKTLLFTVPVIVFFEVLFHLGFSPIVTNSTLFDIKMLKVQKQHIKNVELMAIGSSITLYELKSAIMLQNFNMPYYNFATWGIQMTDIKLLLPSFVDEYQPKYVIMCASVGEFKSPRNNTYLNYLSTNRYIRNHFPEIFYLKNYNSLHRLIRRKYYKYPIDFDNWGGASRAVHKNISGHTLDVHDVFPTPYTQENYKALDSVGFFLKQKNIRFIFIEAPIKSSFANTAIYQQRIKEHFDKCRSIVEKQGGIYLNYYNPAVFTDSLFADTYHLQDAGSVILTNEIVKDLKGIIK